MTYKIGTRVKKVRGVKNVGATGVVIEHPSSKTVAELVRIGHWPPGTDAIIKTDVLMVAIGGDARVYPGGKIAISSEEWEPIVPDGAAPCEWSQVLCNPDGTFNDNAPLPSFKEELDHATP